MAATFDIHPLSRFESGQTSIRRPKEFLCFSFDEHHEIKLFSSVSLRYYYPPFSQSPGVPVPPIDLSNGFDQWIKTDQSIDKHLEGLLDTIQAHEEALMSDGSTELSDVRTKTDFVTWRGMMTKIMTAPFDIFSDFEMNATCYQGTIFIEENWTYALADKEQQSSRPPHPGEISQEMMQYWGYKFENLCSLDRPWAECTRDEIDARDDEIANNNVQYCSIVKTGIGNASLILGGEVDCVLGEKPEYPDTPIPWVELKTTAEPLNDNPRERQKFERKLLKFWAQSFLLSVPTIVVGFRSQNGYLVRIQEFETQKLPGIVARGEGSWNGNVCINTTGAFLDFLKVKIQRTEGVWRIKRKKSSKTIDVFRVEESGTGDILSANFKAHREKLVAAEIVRKLDSNT